MACALVKLTLNNWLGIMSKMSKRTLIASTVIGVFAMGSTAVSADPLENLHKENAKTHAAAKKSQEKINSLFEQAQDLLVEYRAVVDETENLKVYNDYVASLVADQERNIASLQSQIDSIEETKSIEITDDRTYPIKPMINEPMRQFGSTERMWFAAWEDKKNDLYIDQQYVYWTEKGRWSLIQE